MGRMVSGMVIIERCKYNYSNVLTRNYIHQLFIPFPSIHFYEIHPICFF